MKPWLRIRLRSEGSPVRSVAQRSGGVADFIAQDDPIRAASFVAELVRKAHEIGDLPEGYPRIARYDRARRRAYGRYLIIYRVETDYVLILRILHGSRDYEALLPPPH